MDVDLHAYLHFPNLSYWKNEDSKLYAEHVVIEKFWLEFQGGLQRIELSLLTYQALWELEQQPKNNPQVAYAVFMAVRFTVHKSWIYLDGLAFKMAQVPDKNVIAGFY